MPRDYRYRSSCELTHIISCRLHWYRNFLILISNVFICKNISKSLRHIIVSFTKIIEFDNVKLKTKTKNISSKDAVWNQFLEIDSNSTFSKKWVLRKSEFSYPSFQWIGYNNVVVTKKNYFSPTFLKSWAHISDNIIGAVGVPQYY